MWLGGRDSGWVVIAEVLDKPLSLGEVAACSPVNTSGAGWEPSHQETMAPIRILSF